MYNPEIITASDADNHKTNELAVKLMRFMVENDALNDRGINALVRLVCFMAHQQGDDAATALESVIAILRQNAREMEAGCTCELHKKRNPDAPKAGGLPN